MVLGTREVGEDAKTHNNAVEQTAGSPSLATAAHRERWAGLQDRAAGENDLKTLRGLLERKSRS